MSIMSIVAANLLTVAILLALPITLIGIRHVAAEKLRAKISVIRRRDELHKKAHDLALQVQDNLKRRISQETIRDAYANKDDEMLEKIITRLSEILAEQKEGNPQ